MFEDSGAAENIRVLASLYNETIQIVAPADSGIRTVEDLAGKRVSIGCRGSGTEMNALQILETYGMSEADLAKCSGCRSGIPRAIFRTARWTPRSSRRERRRRR